MSKVDKSIFQSETQKYFSAQDSKEFLRRRNDGGTSEKFQTLNYVFF